MERSGELPKRCRTVLIVEPTIYLTRSDVAFIKGVTEKRLTRDPNAGGLTEYEVHRALDEGLGVVLSSHVGVQCI